MNANNSQVGVNKVKRDKKTIALRINDDQLYKQIEALAREQKISLNLAVNMLLGFAFNEVSKQNKKFIPKIVFESK